MSSGLYSGVSGLALGVGLYKNTSGLWSGSTGLIAGFDGGTPYSGASLYLDFLSGALDSRITFSRGSQATLVDSTGKLTYAPNNLLTYSERFDNAAWVRTNATVNANATLAPDGTLTADKAVGTATSGFHLVSQSVTTAAATYIYSAYFKTAEYSKATLSNGTGGTWAAAFDLASGTVVNTYGASVGSASISNVGNGWFRCSVTFTATAAAILHSAGGYPNSGATLGGFGAQYTGDGTSGVFIWGAQLEQVTYQTTPSTYTATTASAYYGPRFDYDPVTLAAKGLLIEEQRTNLLTYSAQFDNAAWSKNNTTITANATLSPDGTTNADKLAETATTAVHNAGQSITTTATAYNFSCYVKAAERNFALLYHTQSNASVSVNLSTGATGTASGTVAPTSSSVTAVGNGWWRVTMTVTATAASNFFGVYVMNDLVNASYAGTAGSGIFIWGAQLEAGAFATSYIPTVASTVTRSADVATMTGTNFSSWYNQTEGTLEIEGSVPLPASCALGEINDGTNANVMALWTNSVASAGPRTFICRNAGTNTVLINAGTVLANTVTKHCAAYEANNCANSIYGNTAVVDTSATIPTVDRLYIGSTLYAALFANGHIRSIAYYNTRLPNSQLQTLSAPTLNQPLLLDFIGNNYTVGY